MSHKIKLGRVSKFDGTTGEIVTENDRYLLLDKDIEDDNIKKGSYVLFRDEEINGQKRAFFVKEYNKDDKNNKYLIK